ncbi:MAG: FCD domain-containing protein, partial [Rhodobacteraceae bacterium]|nr:FCD domain-containing protein [Paracoccaceae bacterium]
VKAWPPGCRVPAERDLAEQFNVGRNAVRRALADLEASGVILRHVGRGTFVRDPHADGGSSESTNSRSINPAEIMEVRLLLEPAMAELIVARASQVELESLQKLVDRGGAARNMAEFEQWDSRFHNALVELAKNDYLAGLLGEIHAIRQEAAWGKLKRRGLTNDRRAAYQIEHKAIVGALLDRDAETAQSAIRAHLRHVRHNLTGF